MQRQISLSAVILVIAACSGCGHLPGKPVVFVNGNVITMDPVTRVEEAVVVLDGRIQGTGTTADMTFRAGPHRIEVDLEGRTVMPGFVDPHNHVYNAVFLGNNVNLVGTTYAEAQDRLIAAGTTTVANGNVWQDALVDFQQFVDAGGIRARTRVYLGYNDFCGPERPAGWYLAYPPNDDPAAMFGVAGIKIFADGGACNRGALSFFADGGDLYFTADELATAIEEVQALGYQVLIHTIGDIAIDTAHAALADALSWGPNDYRHRMDHNRYIRTNQLAHYSDVGAVPIVFGSPFTCSILDGDEWSFLMNNAYAPLRHRFDPWRALIDANPELHVAWKSDAPIWTYAPIIHLWGLVTRDELAQDGSLCTAPTWLKAGAVTVEEALQMMTINAAYALWMDDVVGSLAPGKYADLIVLSDDPLSVNADSIRNIEVLMTMIGGKVEHCKAGSERFCPDQGTP